MKLNKTQTKQKSKQIKKKPKQNKTPKQQTNQKNNQSTKNPEITVAYFLFGKEGETHHVVCISSMFTLKLFYQICIFSQFAYKDIV